MRKFIDEFFHCCLVKRDLVSALSFLTENIITVGTDIQETAAGKTAVQELLECEFKKLPSPLSYEIDEFTETQESESMRNVFARLRVTWNEGNRWNKISCCFTASCIRTKENWHISCLHLSRFTDGQEQRHKIEMMAYMDALTEMGNRAAFNEELQECRQYPHVACVVADINNLKLCNDRYGHKEGDRIITDAAECIRGAFAQLGTCYRIGGDEFCVLIREGKKAEVLQALEQVADRIAEKNKHRVMPLSIAFGYAFREGMKESMEQLFNRGDEMMYDVKHRMKNEFPVYREEKLSHYLNVLKILKKSTDDYLFLWDIGRDEFWYSDDIDRDYAIHTNEKPTISSADLDNIVYPADRKLLFDDLKRIADGIQQEHDLNYRWMNRKGEPVWINCRGQVIADDKGRPFCMIGRVSDQLLRYLYNPLTKLFNKEKMFRDFEEQPLINGYFMLISINNLKAINLKYGRSYGDQVIKQCGETIEKSGLAKHIWHIESNCFALYLTVETKMEVQSIYNSLLTKLSGLCTIAAGAVPNDKGMFEDKRHLYACAELTLEKSKTTNKKNVLFFSREDLEKREKSMRLLEELRRNVKNHCHGFSLHY